MAEYIEREELIEYLETAKEKLLIENSFESRCAAQLIGIFIVLIENFAAADVAPVRHGEWCGTVCSACGESTSFYYDCDYCPRCGAKMDGRMARTMPNCDGCEKCAAYCANCNRRNDTKSERRGCWVEEDTAITCPICTRSYDTDFEIKRRVVLGFKYCPECGARMDGENNG